MEQLLQRGAQHRGRAVALELCRVLTCVAVRGVADGTQAEVEQVSAEVGQSAVDEFSVLVLGHESAEAGWKSRSTIGSTSGPDMRIMPMAATCAPVAIAAIVSAILILLIHCVNDREQLERRADHGGGSFCRAETVGCMNERQPASAGALLIGGGIADVYVPLQAVAARDKGDVVRLFHAGHALALEVLYISAKAGAAEKALDIAIDAVADDVQPAAPGEPAQQLLKTGIGLAAAVRGNVGILLTEAVGTYFEGAFHRIRRRAVRLSARR